MQAIKKQLLYLATFLLVGCLNEANMAGELAQKAEASPEKPRASICTIPTTAFKNLPTEVLDGTDVTDLKIFQPTDMSGTYFQTEMGGADLVINIQASNNGHVVQRVYIEPGEEKQVANYKNLCISDGLLYGPNIRGIFTKDGLLWLELDSKQEFITPDLWIYTQNMK